MDSVIVIIVAVADADYAESRAHDEVVTTLGLASAYPSTDVAGRLGLAVYKASWDNWHSFPSVHFLEDRPYRLVVGRIVLGRVHQQIGIRWVAVTVGLRLADNLVLVPGVHLQAGRPLGSLEQLLSAVPPLLFERCLLPSCGPSTPSGSP